MNAVRLMVVIGFAVVGLIGCGQGEDFGANTGCGRFNGLSPDDQARAIKAMHIDRGKGTSEAEIATARDAVRAHCAPGDIAGAINDIYDNPTDSSSDADETGAESDPAADERREYRIKFERGGLGQNDDGSTAEGVLTVGEIQTLDSAVADGYELQCFRGDTSRAAAVVGEATMENTTPGFSVNLALGIGTATFVSYPQMGRTVGDMRSDEFLDSKAGSACLSPTATLTRANAEEGERMGPIPFALIFNDYYTPKQPDGDLGRLGRTVISFGGVGWIPKCISGPGADAGTLIPADGDSVTAKADEVSYEVSPVDDC